MPTEPAIERVAAADWPALAPFIHRHNRRADGRERCLHAHQGDTVAQHAHELAALQADEAAFWRASDAGGATTALVGCEFDPALRRAWLRGPVAAGDLAQHGPRLLRALETALESAPGIRCFDAFPAEDEPALNGLYAARGYRRMGVHRVLEADLAASAGAGAAAGQVQDLLAKASADASDALGPLSGMSAMTAAWPLPFGVSVRRVHPGDLPPLLALHESLFPNGYLKPDDFAEALDDRARLVLACAAGGGRLLGYLFAKDDPEQPEIYIDYLGTSPEARGQGLGRALLMQALSWGRALGRPRASLTVREDRAPALALYQRCGFRQVSAGVHWRRELPEVPLETD